MDKKTTKTPDKKADQASEWARGSKLETKGLDKNESYKKEFDKT